jgi:hypothetical protein
MKLLGRASLLLSRYVAAQHDVLVNGIASLKIGSGSFVATLVMVATDVHPGPPESHVASVSAM